MPSSALYKHNDAAGVVDRFFPWRPGVVGGGRELEPGTSDCLQEYVAHTVVADNHSHEKMTATAK